MTLSAMLLAGGHSRRMGREKATLSVKGGLLWDRQLQLLSSLSPAVLWVSARKNPPWCPSGVEVIPDESPSRGPLSGLAAGLRRLQTSHLLVLAIDLPQMSVEHLRKLWALASPGSGVIPLKDDYFEPLCAIYPAEAAPIAEEALKSGNASLQALVKTLLSQSRAQTYAITQSERSLYFNWNRPSDLPPRKIVER